VNDLILLRSLNKVDIEMMRKKIRKENTNTIESQNNITEDIDAKSKVKEQNKVMRLSRRVSPHLDSNSNASYKQSNRLQESINTGRGYADNSSAFSIKSS
jgi:hypothetical protein